MEVLLCYIIIYITEALILWLYCNDLFTPRYSVRRTILFLSLLYSILFLLSRLDISPLNASAFFIANFIFIYALYDTRWFIALFHAGITTTAVGIGEVFTFSFFPEFVKNFYEVRSNIGLLATCTFFSKLLYFFIIYLLSHLPMALQTKKAAGSQSALMLIPIPVATSFVMITFDRIYFTVDISDSVSKMIAVCCILLIFLNLLIWFFFSYTQKQNEEFTELQLSLQRENDTVKYYRMLNAQNETKNLLIHNIKGHLCTIASLAGKNRQQEIIDYIDNLTRTPVLQSSDTSQLCKNDTLNAILCRYKEECKKHGICFRTDIRNDCIDFMTANDLTALFCNLLDNAMEAAACVSDSFIEINLSQQENTPYTVLSVVNSCPENPFDSHGNLPSHKKDAINHGLGLKSIRRTVKNYGGDMEVYYEEGTGSFHAVVRLKADVSYT